MKWNRWQEQGPPEGEQVLIAYYARPQVDMAVFEDGHWHRMTFNVQPPYMITHWTKMPEAPDEVV